MNPGPACYIGDDEWRWILRIAALIDWKLILGRLLVMVKASTGPIGS